MKYLAAILALSVAACSTTVDPVKNPEVYKPRKNLTLPKEVCVKYPNAKTKCL